MLGGHLCDALDTSGSTSGGFDLKYLRLVDGEKVFEARRVADLAQRHLLILRPASARCTSRECARRAPEEDAADLQLDGWPDADPRKQLVYPAVRLS